MCNAKCMFQERQFAGGDEQPTASVSLLYVHVVNRLGHRA